MKEYTYIYVEMADKEAKSYLAAKNTKLFKNFKLKPLKLTCVCFLYSIITSSILSIANSSSAFTARLKDDQEELNIYGLPSEIEDNRYKEMHIKQNNQVTILYCRSSDRWCYLEGYSKRRKNYLLRGWIQLYQICGNTSIDFLPPCGDYDMHKELTRFLNTTIRKFYCKNRKEPLYWFDDDVKKALCRSK